MYSLEFEQEDLDRDVVLPLIEFSSKYRSRIVKQAPYWQSVREFIIRVYEDYVAAWISRRAKECKTKAQTDTRTYATVDTISLTDSKNTGGSIRADTDTLSVSLAADSCSSVAKNPYPVINGYTTDACLATALSPRASSGDVRDYYTGANTATGTVISKSTWDDRVYQVHDTLPAAFGKPIAAYADDNKTYYTNEAIEQLIKKILISDFNISLTPDNKLKFEIKKEEEINMNKQNAAPTRKLKLTGIFPSIVRYETKDIVKYTFTADDSKPNGRRYFPVTVKQTTVYFKDGTSTSATNTVNDAFDLETGITVCVMKKLCGDDFKILVKNLIKNQEKAEKAKEEAEAKAKEEKARFEAKKAKRAEKQYQKTIMEQAKYEADLAKAKAQLMNESKPEPKSKSKNTKQRLTECKW